MFEPGLRQAEDLFLFSSVVEHLGKNEKEMACLTNVIF